jgi:hypothetical protein
VSWAAFLVVWGVSAFFVKRDVRDGGAAALWQRHWMLRLAVSAVIIVVAVRHSLLADDATIRDATILAQIGPGRLAA